MTEKCFVCRFWAGDRRSTWATEDERGDCRRHAPIAPLVVRTTNEPRTYTDREWPRVIGTEWCGDFEMSNENADRPSARSTT
jgi:hypothetical protein